MINPKTIIENTLVPHTAFSLATTQLDQCFRYAQDAIEPICLPILGESRTGKSRSLETFLMKHPRNRQPDGMHIPALYIRVPAKPTVKGFVEQMLRAIGDPKFDKGTEQVKTHRLQQLMTQCKTRMVVMDEFQHFVDKGSSKVAYHVADWLKLLVDECKVAIVVAGLPSCRKVLMDNEQFAGRFMSPVILPRFDWNNANHADEFIAILGAFHEQMAVHFDLPELQSSEMAFRFYCASGGLIGYLAKMLRAAVWMACDQNRKSISLEDLSAAFCMSISMDKMGEAIPNPFSRGFIPQPTTHLLELVANIGKHVEPAISRRAAACLKEAA